MLLVLACLDDLEALWFAQAAVMRGQACTVLTTETLSFARRRSLRVTDDATSTTIELTDGTVIEGTELSGVLNRSVGPPDAAWRRAIPVERHYAAAELQAFMLGWLHGLECPVRNRPDTVCLAGPAPHGLVAAAAAQAAGFVCPVVEIGSGATLSSTDVLAHGAWTAAGPAAVPRHVVCLDGEIVGEAPDDVRAAAAAFVRLVGAGETLIGLDFADDGSSWWFTGMTALPRLSTAGPALVGRVLSILGSTVPESST